MKCRASACLLLVNVTQKGKHILGGRSVTRETMTPKCLHLHTFHSKSSSWNSLSIAKNAVYAIYRSGHSTGCPITTWKSGFFVLDKGF
jgi:hypothetical protein